MSISIKRREYLAGMGLSVLSSWSTPLWAQQAGKPWRLGHQLAVDHPVARGTAKAAEVLLQKSGGRLRLDLFPSGQMGTGREITQQVSDDTLDFTVEGPSQLGNWHRPLTIFEAPFLARDWGHLVRIMDSPWARAQFDTLASKFNLQQVGRPWYYGSRHFTTKSKGLRTPADARGMKLRVPEVAMYLDMIRSIGATPTPMALAEVYMSLQTGVVDGQENPLTVINSTKFFEVQKFVSLTAHIVNPVIPMMSARKWAGLAPEDRKLVIEAFDAGAEVNDELTRSLESRLVDDFKARGVTVVEADRPAFRAVMQPVYERQEAAWGKGVFEQLRAVQ